MTGMYPLYQEQNNNQNSCSSDTIIYTTQFTITPQRDRMKKSEILSNKKQYFSAYTDLQNVYDQSTKPHHHTQ